MAGNVSNPARMPYGKLCGSKDFTYSATFGPFKACGKKKVCTLGLLLLLLGQG